MNLKEFQMYTEQINKLILEFEKRNIVIKEIE